MSLVRAGRLLMFTWKVICPASSFDTATLVMSGARASSPVESVNVCELLSARLEPPRATGAPASTATSMARTPSLAFIAGQPTGRADRRPSARLPLRGPLPGAHDVPRAAVLRYALRPDD